MANCWKKMRFGKDWGPEFRKKTKDATEYIRVMFDDELDHPSWIVSIGTVEKEGKMDAYTTEDAIITGDNKESAMKRAKELIRAEGGLCK